ncbi:MAG: hypothetical protein MUO43_18750, partial [Desulfobacterales bacterium]|nr:hypothetical protein [Desulfobacterales bacterium]
DTQKREDGALLSAMDKLGLERGTIFTWLDEDLSDKRSDIYDLLKKHSLQPSDFKSHNLFN